MSRPPSEPPVPQADYDAALNRREHGGVAAGTLIWRLRERLTKGAPK